ncbi:MAG: DNA replication and repair protein RecF [Patescibacteria group bacterium]
MVLEELKLTNFRNFPKAVFKLSRATTVLYGRNGSGKSNLLEAVYLLATGGSLRAHLEAEMINEKESFASVAGRLAEVTKAEIIKKDPQEEKTLVPKLLKLEVTLIRPVEVPSPSAKSRKRFKVSGIPRLRRDFAGRLRAVLFSPEQIGLVVSDPSYRRSHFDLVLSQVDSKYIMALAAYEKARAQRNRLLYQVKLLAANVYELSYWEGIMVINSVIVNKARENYVEFVNKYLITNRQRFGKLGYFKLIYHPNPLTPERFSQYRDREIQAEKTLIGPHRDDFQFLDVQINPDKETDLRRFGSRGQQRLAVFALKMAEWNFLKVSGPSPIILLDDIFSELDEAHRQIVLANLAGQQAVLTTAEEGVANSILKGLPLIRL